MVSIMMVIIEGAIVLCMPVVFCAGVFITKALYGHNGESATFAIRGMHEEDVTGSGFVPAHGSLCPFAS